MCETLFVFYYWKYRSKKNEEILLHYDIYVLGHLSNFRLRFVAVLLSLDEQQCTLPKNNYAEGIQGKVYTNLHSTL